MVHLQRLISSTKIVTICAITLINLGNFCRAKHHHNSNEYDIAQNLIRDPVEEGNSYLGGGSGDENRIKIDYHQQKPSIPPLLNSFSSSSSSASTEPISPYQQNETEDSEEKPKCPLCTAAKKNAGLDDDTLRSLRIEIVKEQILRKLRLTEPQLRQMENVPKTKLHTALPPLGNPVLSNALRNDQDNDVSNMDMEDFYGKTEHIIVMPQEVTNCASSPEATSCFIFKLPKEVRSNQISSAELWVYKLSDNEKQLQQHQRQAQNSEGHSNSTLRNQHHFSVSEIITLHTSSKTRMHNSLITSRFDIPNASSWINFNITERTRKWLVTEHHQGPTNHTIKISCSTCSQNENEFPFDKTGEQQPFIVFNIANGRKKRRNRRSVNCNAGMTACCRESLYISFAEIGWDWVVEPKGFDAFYCKGNCNGNPAYGQAATRHATVLIDYVNTQGGVNNKTAELVPCCTATEMSAISLIYRDPDNFNSFPQVTLPNMVVQSCGCK